MPRKIWGLVIVGLFALSSLSLAQHAKVGTTSFNFLKIGYGARPMGMGGAFTAISDDANSLFWNPAGLSQISSRLATTTYRSYVAGIKGGYGAYIQPHGETGTFGVGIGYLNFGEMVKKGPNNEILGTGTFGSSALVPTLGFGLQLSEEMGIGLALKGIYWTIDEDASQGLAVDLGGVYRVEEKAFKGAILIQNLGFQVTPFGEEKESLPWVAKAGASYQPTEVLTLALDLVQPVDNKFSLSLGFEWQPRDMFAIRGGYYSMGSDLKVGEPEDVLGGLSFGFGAGWKAYFLDYAVTPMVALGFVHRISLSTKL